MHDVNNNITIEKEIIDFFKNVFEVYEIRGQVGEFKQIKFIVHTRDHNPPHVHAQYDRYEVLISLKDFSVIAGNIPSKNMNKAIKWVKSNKDYLLKHWNERTLISSLPLTKSRLDLINVINQK